MPHLGRLRPLPVHRPAHTGTGVEGLAVRFMPLLSPLMSPFYVSIWHSGHSAHLIQTGCCQDSESPVLIQVHRQRGRVALLCQGEPQHASTAYDENTGRLCKSVFLHALVRHMLEECVYSPGLCTLYVFVRTDEQVCLHASCVCHCAEAHLFLINALQVNFTHGSKEIFYFFFYNFWT